MLPTTAVILARSKDKPKGLPKSREWLGCCAAALKAERFLLPHLMPHVPQLNCVLWLPQPAR